MRKVHIDYLKDMIKNVTIDGSQVIPDSNFLEIVPKVDKIIKSIPCCLVDDVRCETVSTKGETVSTQDITYNDIKYIEEIKRLARQKFTYHLNIVVKDINADILSRPDKHGILEQCMLYVIENNKLIYLVAFPEDTIAKNVYQDFQANALVEFGKNYGIDTSMANQGVYIIYFDVIFADGLYEINEEKTLYGATIEIVPPVEVVSV